MSRTVRIQVKNFVEFELEDDEPLSNYMREHLLTLAKQAVMLMPQSELMNRAKYKIKESK